MKKISKKISKGFTLIEMLVVILIIGILAAIAVPQYKMSVARTKFTTLKSFTKNIVESLQRYYMVNNAYPLKYTELDIDFDEMTLTYSDSQEFDFSVSGGISCTVWFKNDNLINCSMKIFGTSMSYYVLRDTNKPYICRATSTNIFDIANRLCQKETGRKTGDCSGSACAYSYPK